jgi:hypothetical protein
MERAARHNSFAMPLHAAALFLLLTPVQCSSGGSGAGPCAEGAFAGQYQGTWGESGSETGTWQATVDSCGAVSGTGDGGAFTITGTIDSSGRMQFGATAEDGTITAIFTGTGDAAGNVSGTWIDSTGSTTGTFHGGRTSASGPDAAAPVGTEQPAPMLCDPLNDTCAVGTRCEFSCSDPPVFDRDGRHLHRGVQEQQRLSCGPSLQDHRLQLSIGLPVFAAVVPVGIGSAKRSFGSFSPLAAERLAQGGR